MSGYIVPTLYVVPISAVVIDHPVEVCERASTIVDTRNACGPVTAAAIQLTTMKMIILMITDRRFN